jgi:hypothetical protein
MLACAVPGIYYRDRRKFSRKPGSPLFGMADNDRVSVPAYHPYRIGKSFAFCHRAGFDTAYRYGASPQPCHCRFKRHSCAGTWFKKEDGKDFAAESVFIIRVFPDLLCMIEQPVDCSAVKIPDRYNVMRGNSSRALFPLE